MGKSIRSHHNNFSDKPHYEQVPFLCARWLVLVPIGLYRRSHNRFYIFKRKRAYRSFCVVIFASSFQ